MYKLMIIALILAISSTTANANAPDYTENLYSHDTHPEIYCMALNIYYEARSDNLAGQFAVADVVLNRVDDTRFPDTVCGVVQATRTNSTRLDRCAFSWFCDGKTDKPKLSRAWRAAQIIAYQIIQFDTMRGITDGGTHYHAVYVTPYWASSLEHIGRIGSHVFYR
jgi:spore germination cell wall hydrolase CwlJ-like protein